MRRPRFATPLSAVALAAAVAGAQARAEEGAPPERTAAANYILRCAGCHGLSGEGTVVGGVPTFLGSVSALAADDRGRTYMANVPGVLSASLGDAEIAAVFNYVLERWGDGGPVPPFTAGEVAARQAEAVGDIVAFRRDLAERLRHAGVTLADYPWP
ncbi:c-type cytochrome [Rubellimicrobium aerolatum]|uniref:C-type cytochrome n=1 Tax=Rubellimicrobium aerolatum TaxID=490979 RepID=A0ABW0SAD6_9RHOB|nr:hypothetical protein [Rubellimicrobium aerolatum]MBP1805257.1 mono/diheme cytochrome c family protein [Rubellimicrobium aerolatum]